MRHAAMIQPKPERPPLLIGLGETRADAMAGARAWFSAEMDRTSSKDWPRLFALQEQLTVYTEDEFPAKTGMGLDDWLAGMSAAGTAPTVASAAAERDAWVPLPTPKGNNSSLLLVVYCALSALIFIGVLAGVKYGGTHILNREIESITNSNNSFDIGSGPSYNSDFETIDPDDLWGDMYGPIDGMGPSIGGVSGQ
jgi:hypothetical protein